MDSLRFVMSWAWDVLSYPLVISPFRLPLWTFGAFPVLCAFIMKLIFKRRKL